MITQFPLYPDGGIIHRFVGPHRFLSNFYIEPDGTHVEGEYQALKVQDDSLRFLSPCEAKKFGNVYRMQTNWDRIKIGVMRELVFRKFDEHPTLRNLLLDTRDAHIEEGNTWGDRFWGVCDGVGHNHLGRILKWVRGEVIPF